MSFLLDLSTEDRELFKCLQGWCLFPSLAVPGSGELADLYLERKREEERNFIAPYADLLEDELVRILTRRQHIILRGLKNSKDSSFTVELVSWMTVSYDETLAAMNARVAKMSSEERERHDLYESDRKKSIKARKLEFTFGVAEAPVYGYSLAEEMDWTRRPVKVDRIFRQSDLAMRLSLKLGPNFFPFTKVERILLVEGLPGVNNGYRVLKKTLCVRYYPFGVPETKLKSLLAVAKKEKERLEKGERATLGPHQDSVGYGALVIHE